MNNLTELKGNWDQVKATLKEKIEFLTQGDLLFTEGKEEEILCRLQTKLGRSKDEVHKIISEL